MTGIRIRWAVLGKVAAIAIAGLAALQVLPGMLRAPEPPPLAADVGLPRPEPVPRFQRHEARAKGTTDRRAKLRRPKKRLLPALAPGVISSAPRRHWPSRRPPPPPPPVPAELPPAAVPEAPAAALSEPPPPANDGSVEFAPH